MSTILFGNKNNSGSILLEALISIIIIGLVFSVLLDIGVLSLKTSASIEKITEADFLLKESMESARSFRDGTDWSLNGLGLVNTGTSNPYYFNLDTTVNPNKWNLISGTETIGIFTRKIIFDKVSRDPATKNIESVYNASHYDPDTKKVTAIVSWEGKTSQVITYFTNWKND